VDSDQVGPPLGGQRGRRDSRVAARVRIALDRPEHRLVGVPHQHRAAQRLELAEAVQQFEALARGLPEPQPRIDDDLLPGEPRALGAQDGLAQLVDDVPDHVVVLGVDVGVYRRVEAVHHHQRGAVLGGDPRHLGVRQPGDVVEDVGARVEGRAGHRGLPGVDGEEDLRVREPFDHRYHPLPLLGDRDRVGARSRGFPAHVDHVRPRVDHLLGASHCVRDRLVAAAVVEGIGRDVQNAHHRRPLLPGVTVSRGVVADAQRPPDRRAEFREPVGLVGQSLGQLPELLQRTGERDVDPLLLLAAQPREGTLPAQGE
jgi:hypothetical protein